MKRGAFLLAEGFLGGNNNLFCFISVKASLNKKIMWIFSILQLSGFNIMIILYAMYNFDIANFRIHRHVASEASR